MARWHRDNDGPMAYGPPPERPADAELSEPGPLPRPPEPPVAPPPGPGLPPPPPPVAAPMPIAPWAPPPGAYAGNVPGAATLQYGRTLDRVMAYLLDGFIIAIPVIVLTVILGGTAAGSLRAGGVSLVAGIIALGIHLLYFVAFWTGGARATPGMRLMKLQIGDARNGETLTVQQGLVRWLALGGVFQLIDLVPVLAVLGVLLTLIWEVVLLATTASSPTKQGLHDRIANSALVQPAGAQTPATACLLIVVALFVIWMVGVVLLIFLGTQVSSILSAVGTSV